MDKEFGEIANAMQLYFDGFYEGDVATLEKIFHPACHLYNAADGPLVDDDMDTVYTRVRGRQAPAVNSEKRQDKIISIDVASAESALAKVQIAIGVKLFTDYLNLLKVDGQWRIIAKSFTYVLIEAEAAAQAAE